MFASPFILTPITHVETLQMEPVSKRHKTDDSVNDWELEFTSRGDLERIVKAIKEVSSSITFRIFDDEDFKGIVVEVMHNASICLIRSRLACSIIKSPPQGQNTHCTLHCADLLLVLKSTKSQFNLRMCCAHGDDRVCFLSYDEMQNDYRSRTWLNTLQENVQTLGDFKKLEYDYSLRMDAAFFKSVLKINRDLGAKEITIRVSGRQTDNATKIQLCCEGERSCDTKEYVSIPRESASADSDSGDNVIALDLASDSSLVSDADLVKSFNKTLVEETYAIEYLLNFVKSIDSKPVVVIKLGNDKPLLIESELSTPNSKIWFLQSVTVT